MPRLRFFATCLPLIIFSGFFAYLTATAPTFTMGFLLLSALFTGRSIHQISSHISPKNKDKLSDTVANIRQARTSLPRLNMGVFYKWPIHVLIWPLILTATIINAQKISLPPLIYAHASELLTLISGMIVLIIVTGLQTQKRIFIKRSLSLQIAAAALIFIMEIMRYINNISDTALHDMVHYAALSYLIMIMASYAEKSRRPSAYLIKKTGIFIACTSLITITITAPPVAYNILFVIINAAICAQYIGSNTRIKKRKVLF